MKSKLYSLISLGEFAFLSELKIIDFGCPVEEGQKINENEEDREMLI